jgi:hypothetical protein
MASEQLQYPHDSAIGKQVGYQPDTGDSRQYRKEKTETHCQVIRLSGYTSLQVFSREILSQSPHGQRCERSTSERLAARGA